MKANYSATAVHSRSALTAASTPGEVYTRLLDGLEQPVAKSILAAATARRYSANSVIATQGDPADYFFLLTSGCARTFFITQEGRKVLLRWNPPGEVLGGAAILPGPAYYLVSTEMVKDSRVFVWHRKTIRELTARYPRLLENMLPFALDHLTWFLASHLALVSSTARERLAQVMVSLAQGIGYKVPGGIGLDITNEQLANSANITPFTASRLLNQWQRDGALSKTRGKLILYAPHRLFLHEV